MKKRTISLFLVCILLLFASCATPVVKTDTSPSPPPATGIGDTTSPSSQSAEPESAVPSAVEPSASADSSMTLESIKKAALAAGYKVEENQDFSILGDPKPVDSFTLIYEDESMSAYTPIYEFKSSTDAQTFAEEVNAEGYNLCIVNGKFLTTTGSSYGIVTNDKEAGVMEMLLQSTVMAYQEPAFVPPPPAVDYASTYLHVDAIYKALDKLVNKSILLHDKTAPEEERVSKTGLWFTLVSSGDLSFTSALSEDQAQLDAVTQVWEMFGVTDFKLTHKAANDYILSGKRAGLDTSFELHCSYNPKNGALRLIDTDGGEVIEFYEYVPLGNDTYAFQTLYSRAIVEYKDGKVLSFVYSLNTQDKALAYTAKADGIFENTAGVNEAWVSKAGADTYDQFITFDGTTIKIAANSFFGDRVTFDIKAQ